MIRQPKSLISRTVVAASIAWLIGLPCLFVSSFLLSGYQGNYNFLENPILALPFMGLATAFIVFPACVGLGLPLFMLLPKTSLLWRPFFATITGVILGVVAMLFLLTMFSSHHLDRIDSRSSLHQFMLVILAIVDDWIDWHDTFNQSMMVTSAIVGGSFAYISARLNCREEKTAVASA
jgi:hypothetical protein